MSYCSLCVLSFFLLPLGVGLCKGFSWHGKEAEGQVFNTHYVKFFSPSFFVFYFCVASWKLGRIVSPRAGVPVLFMRINVERRLCTLHICCGGPQRKSIFPEERSDQEIKKRVFTILHIL